MNPQGIIATIVQKLTTAMALALSAYLGYSATQAQTTAGTVGAALGGFLTLMVPVINEVGLAALHRLLQHHQTLLGAIGVDPQTPTNPPVVTPQSAPITILGAKP